MSSQYFSDDGSMNSLDSSDSTAWSIDSFIMESIEVEESKDDFMKTLEKDLQVEVEKESYGDMDEFQWKKSIRSFRSSRVKFHWCFPLNCAQRIRSVIKIVIF